MTRYLIYGLIDPRNEGLRYIGRSSSGLNRPKAHERDTTNSHKTRWIAQLKAAGLTYEIEVLEVVESPDLLNEAECFFIAYFRSLGCRLTNLTDGGERVGGWVHRRETRAKLRAVWAKRRLLSRMEQAKKRSLKQMEKGERFASASLWRTRPLF